MVSKVLAGGKRRPFYFAFRALAQLTDELGISISELGAIDKSLTLKAVGQIAYLGFQHGYQKAKKEIDFTKDDVLDWFDNDFGMVETVMEEFGKQVEQYMTGGKKNTEEAPLI